MTDLRTAAQQALAFTMRDFTSLRDFEAAKAVLHDNLRAALAQQEEPQTLDAAMAQAYENGYKAGAAAEREACAKACDDKAKETFSGQCQVWGDYFARAIRARSKE